MRLEQAGVSTGRAWLAMQANYDLWQAMQHKQPPVRRLQEPAAVSPPGEEFPPCNRCILACAQRLGCELYPAVRSFGTVTVRRRMLTFGSLKQKSGRLGILNVQRHLVLRLCLRLIQGTSKHWPDMGFCRKWVQKNKNIG